MIVYRFLAWAAMTAFCFIGLTVVLAFFPLLGSFIAWEFIDINWPVYFVLWRLFFALSAFIGIMFAFDHAGKDFASEVKELVDERRASKAKKNGKHEYCP